MADISKSQVKLVRSLQHKKFRDQLHLFVAEGDKCINELKKTFHPEFLANASNATPQAIEQMSSLKTPQGSIAVFQQRNEVLPHPLEDIVLVLDGVQDPGNLGTIIRTADWFGIKHIVCSHDTADCYNPKVVQATMGALARVHIHYTDLVSWLQQHENIPVYGTLLEGRNMYHELRNTDMSSPKIIIMGNEGNGISSPVRPFITCPVRIPSFPADAETSESLNVAIATAIVLHEFRRP